MSHLYAHVCSLETCGYTPAPAADDVEPLAVEARHVLAPRRPAPIDIMRDLIAALDSADVPEVARLADALYQWHDDAGVLAQWLVSAPLVAALARFADRNRYRVAMARRTDPCACAYPAPVKGGGYISGIGVREVCTRCGRSIPEGVL